MLKITLTLSIIFFTFAQQGAAQCPNLGLYNFGATCYMNASLQCLFKTKQLHDLIISLNPNTIELGCTESQINNAPHIPGLAAHRQPYQKFLANHSTLQQFIILQQALYHDTNNKFITPFQFNKALQISAEAYNTLAAAGHPNVNQQQDATEFICLILDILTFNIVIEQPAYDSFGNQTKKINRIVPFKISEQIEPIFTGKTVDLFTCSTCNHSTITKRDPIQQISFELHNLATNQALADGTTLPQCFEKYTSAEQIDDVENGWICPNCAETKLNAITTPQSLKQTLGPSYAYFFNNPNTGTAQKILLKIKKLLQPFSTTQRTISNDMFLSKEEQKALVALDALPPKQPYSKKIIFADLPPVLITTLKRFSFNTTTGNRQKITTKIAFPKNFFIRSSWVTDDCPAKGSWYELYGLIIHSGSCNGGHYWAYAQDYETKNWYEFDDCNVSAITIDSHLSDAGIYAAFYKRTDDLQTPSPEDIHARLDKINLLDASDSNNDNAEISSITKEEISTLLENLHTKLCTLEENLKKLEKELRRLKAFIPVIKSTISASQ